MIRFSLYALTLVALTLGGCRRTTTATEPSGMKRDPTTPHPACDDGCGKNSPGLGGLASSLSQDELDHYSGH